MRFESGRLVPKLNNGAEKKQHKQNNLADDFANQIFGEKQQFFLNLLYLTHSVQVFDFVHKENTWAARYLLVGVII